MQNEIIRLGNKNAKHRYEIQITARYDVVVVDANNRTQAATIAKKAGYNVMSVNMVG